jgi:hypothetical protein
MKRQLSDKFNKQFEGASQNMTAEESHEYAEMKKLLDDPEICRIAQPVFRYLKATLLIRKNNVDCSVKYTNSGGYTNEEPRYVYPWGFSQILLNSPEITLPDLQYLARAYSNYFQIKKVEKHYSWTSTKGNRNEGIAEELWITAPEKGAFLEFLQKWPLGIPKITISETSSIREAIRWYFLLTLLEYSESNSPIIDIEESLSRIAQAHHVQKEFLDFRKMFTPHSNNNLNQIQPFEDQRTLYVLGKCKISYNILHCDDYESILIDPTLVAQLRKRVALTAADVKASIISDYVKYMSEDPSHVFQLRRAIESLKSKIGENELSAIASGSISTEEKELLENNGLVKTLPSGGVILARTTTVEKLNQKLSYLIKQAEKMPETWWNRIIEITANRRDEIVAPAAAIQTPVVTTGRVVKYPAALRGPSYQRYLEKLRCRRAEARARKQSLQPPAKTALIAEKEWDLFICHASEDKEEIVRPLANALVDAGYRIWYDEFELKLGDSLRRSIDKGLAGSRYGIVILSPNFFAKGWPQTELDGLAAKERNGEKVILPVWHNVDAQYVREFSPTLGDKLAALTSKGVQSVVREVQRVLGPGTSARV